MRRTEHRLDIDLPAPGGLLHDGFFFRLGRVANSQLEHEAVELRLGQRVGAFLLDGVLGGEDEERLGQVVRGSADGYLVLLHGLEQRRLGLGWRPVDLVGQHYVGEDGAVHEPEGPLAAAQILFDDLRAGDVAGHQVGGELDAVEAQIQRRGHGRDHEGLGQARYPDQEGVPAGQDRRDDAVDRLFLPHDALGHLATEVLDRMAQALELLDVIEGIWLGGGHE
jgi:hypothetical protein